MFGLAEYMQFGKDGPHMYHWKCLQCGKEFDAKLWTPWFKQSGVKSYARCCNCYPEETGKSAEEIEFFNEVKRLTSHEVLANAKVFEDKLNDRRTFKEIDVYIPQLKFEFEYDGIWWHSVEMKSTENTSDTHYHLKKTLLAEKAGLKLVHIRSDMWKNDKHDMTEMIKHMISGDIDFQTMADDGKHLVLDRSIWCKSWNFAGFELEEETSPQVIEVKSGNNVFHNEDCGKLIFKNILL